MLYEERVILSKQYLKKILRYNYRKYFKIKVEVHYLLWSILRLHSLRRLHRNLSNNNSRVRFHIKSRMIILNAVNFF